MATIREIEKDVLEVTGVVNCLRIRLRFSRTRHGDDFREIAKAKHAELIFENAGLTDPAWSAKARNLRKMTVAMLASRYIAEHLVMTRAKGNASFVRLITDKWGEHRLNAITIERVRPWIYQMLTQPYHGKMYSPYSVKKVVRYFQRLYNWGNEMGIIDGTPLKHLVDRSLAKAFKRSIRPRKQTISEKEFWELVTRMPTWLRRAACASWYTGMRLGEVCSLTWDQVHGDLIQYEPDSTKECDAKTIVMCQDLRDIIAKIQVEQLTNGHHRHRNHVFCGCTGAPLSVVALSKSWHWYCEKLEVSGVRFHDLRRSWINRMETAGKSLRAIMSQVGHHAATTTQIYRSVSLEEQRSLAEKVKPLPISSKVDQQPTNETPATN